MSVIVREEESGRIWLLTKGAESSVLTRCINDTKTLNDVTLSHIDHFAMVSHIDHFATISYKNPFVIDSYPYL